MRNEMKILYHHRTLGDGAEGIHIREMVKAFRALGHQVKVIGPAGESVPEHSAKPNKLSLIKQRIPAILYELLEIAYTPYCLLKTSWEIHNFKPDFIYDRYITFNAGIVLAGKIRSIPVCLEVNAPLAMERSTEQDERLIFKQLASWIERWVCTNATETIVVSTPLKSYLESIGVPKDKCVVMPNGADPDHFIPKPKDQQNDLRQTLKIPQDYFIVGFTGILRPWHGLDLLINAVERMLNNGHKVFLLIVGDGPYRETLEKIAKQANIESSVRITGRISHGEIPDYVALFDAAVSPRATFYASPMKVLEYMALGKPVVVPATPNFFDIIEEGSEGISFTEGNAKSLEQAILRLYQSTELRQTIGRRARQKVEQRLNWQWNADKVCQLILEKQ